MKTKSVISAMCRRSVDVVLATQKHHHIILAESISEYLPVLGLPEVSVGAGKVLLLGGNSPWEVTQICRDDPPAPWLVNWGTCAKAIAPETREATLTGGRIPAPNTQTSKSSASGSFHLC